MLETNHRTDPLDDDLALEDGPLSDDSPHDDMDDTQKDTTDSATQAETDSASVPVPGARPYVWRRPSAELTTWWWGLPDETRAALAALHPGDVLSRSTAAAVEAAGLPCPRVPAVVAGRRVVRWVATAALLRTIHLVRMTHSERRLV